MGGGRYDPGVTEPALPALAVDGLEAVVFDTDGVLTDTASVHAAAWKRLFDEYLTRRTSRGQEPFRPCEEADYLRSIDGRPRYDGVAGFLASRGIQRPGVTRAIPRTTRRSAGSATPRTAPSSPTCATMGPGPSRPRSRSSAGYGSAGCGPRWYRPAGTWSPCSTRPGSASCSTSRSTVEADRLRPPGKPDPALFLEAARRLGVAPGRAAVVEDALAGVEGGRHGGFGLVVGVDRGGQAAALAERGADVVVPDLGDLILAGTVPGRGGP
jgi:alpha,alpha-trehalase